MENKAPKGQSQAVADISEILACFNHELDEVGINEIAKRCGMYSSKVHRIVSSLDKKGFLEKNPVTKKYRIGLRLFEMGMLYPIHSSLRKIVRPHAVELAKKFTTNASLAIISKSKPKTAVIIDRVQSSQSAIHAVQTVYANVPLYASAVGKALLAFSEDDFFPSYLEEVTLEKSTDSTITDRKILQNEIRQIKKQGYSISKGELYPSTWSIAAPVRDNKGLVASLSIVDTFEIVDKNKKEMIKSIIQTADFVSYQLGY